MSLDKKLTLLRKFLRDEQQKLKKKILRDKQQKLKKKKNINRFPSKKEIFEFISRTSKIDLSTATTTKGKGGIKRKFTSHDDFEDVVFGEGEKCPPTRVILDDLMTEAFNTEDNDTTMNLLMTKLSHHNNLSVLIICHELYPKGKNSISQELCGGPRTVKKPHKHNREVQESVIRYHGPYVDASGERFYLTRKWHCNDSKKNNWNGCNVNYSFDEDEMNGTQLIKKLHWLGKSNKLMDLIGSIRDQDHNQVNDEIVGGGVKTKKKSHHRQSDDFHDRTLRKAITEMNSMLSNWTLHGQN